MATTYEAIATQTLGSAQASVTFSSIPSTYTDLVLVANGATTTGTTLAMRFNSDNASNYSWTNVYGNGSSALSFRETNQTYAWLGNWYSTFDGTAIINMQNYSNSTTNKTLISRVGNASNFAWASTSLWRSTSAITSFSIFADTTTFVTGSTFSLYGIKAA